MRIIGEEDFSSSIVPRGYRRHWFIIAVTKFGQVAALSQFLLGSILGYGMTFLNAFLAITMGSVILQVVSIAVGIVGQRQGLTTSILTRWTGFGRGGAAVVGATITISSVGWFGIQSAVSAEGLTSTVGVFPQPAWVIIFGLAITVVVLFGFNLIARVSFIAVPIFLILVIFSISLELHEHSIGDLITSEPPGPRLSLITGTGLVAGGFMVGAVINSDLTRYSRSTRDIVKQTIFGISLGEYGIGLLGVLLAHAVSSDNVTTIILSTVGWVGVIVIVLGTVKINDLNLYSAVFGFVNLINTVFGRTFDRRWVTIYVGFAGSVLGAAGILNHFQEFLTFLSVLLPPVAAIMVAEYFLVKRWRKELDESVSTGLLPSTEPIWVPATLIVWAVASAVSVMFPIGLPTINSLVLAFILYVAAAKFGLLHEVGRGSTRERGEISSVHSTS
ncbi:allantoin permease [Rhodococcus sp. ADH]|nr:allantoin permease [Rhodococcus sp. ADH]RGP44602.1 allantoin permease [Rhodococcus erythropolis]